MAEWVTDETRVEERVREWNNLHHRLGFEQFRRISNLHGIKYTDPLTQFADPLYATPSGRLTTGPAQYGTLHFRRVYVAGIDAAITGG